MAATVTPKQPINTTLPDTGFIRLAVLKAVSGLSTSSIYRQMALGNLPKSHKFGSSTLWAVEDIRAWIDAIKGRPAANDATYGGTK